MKGAILRNTGDENLDVVDDLQTVSTGEGQVRVKIKAAGLCHSDLSAMTGVIPQPAPAVLGHEGAGEIIEVGAGVTNVKVGDHVIIAWNAPCGQCSACKRQEPHLCLGIMFGVGVMPRFMENNAPVFGFAGNGTFAEEMVLPYQSVVKIPDDVPFEVAALIGCGVMTGVGAAINTAKVKPGSSVVVFGCGGVGIATIQGAKIAGAADIVAVDMVDKKLDDALRLGATAATKPEGLQDISDKVTSNEGFDYAFECIGLSSTARRAFDSVRRGGTAVIVGAGKADDTFNLNMWEMFFTDKKLLGCYFGAANVHYDFLRLIRLWKTGKLDLEGMISAKLKLDDINEALASMRRGETIRQVFTFD
jgi:S-(hydroxymethyl)glutathione dehydrogenase/alcohol dehydrogenase